MYAGITFILLIAGIIGLALSNRYEKTLLTILFSFIMIVGFVMLVVGDTNYYTAKDQMLFTKNIVLDGQAYYFNNGKLVIQSNAWDTVNNPNKYQVEEIETKNLIASDNEITYLLVKMPLK